jgi:hypothetical protein
LKNKALAFASEFASDVPLFARFQASDSFIDGVCKRYFNDLFQELYVSKSTLKSSPRGANNNIAGDGLFSERSYKYGDKIGFFIGTVSPIREYLDKASQGKTSRCFAIAINNSFVLDCYAHAKEGYCKLSKSNSPYGTGCYLSNGAKATPNCHLKICLPMLQQPNHPLPNSSLGHPYAYLIAGRIKSLHESENDFKRYQASFRIKPGEEILWDYGTSFNL